MYRAPAIRKKILDGELVTIGNVVSSDPQISELMGLCGCDIVWIDLEHAAIDSKDTARHIMAAHAAGAAALIRMPGADPSAVKKILDAGADAILFPQIASAEQARAAVRACCYPPAGIRGWNPIRASQYDGSGPWYLEHSQELVMKFIMLEDIAAVHDLDAILGIEELDGLILGPCDLSGTMGKLTDIYAPDVQAAIRTAVDKCRERKKIVGVALGCGADAATYRYWLDMGVHMVSIGQDISFLAAAVREGTARLLSAAGQPS